MNARLRTLLNQSLFVLFTSLLASRAALAVNWQQPTPEELSMTTAPDAPGADGVYLFREEIGDDKNNFHSIYVRLKVLNEEGKQRYADVEMPIYARGHSRISDVQGRTIHSDGTIVPYTGKPIDKLVVKSKYEQYHTTVFTMPDVQVGSILEYRYALRYDDNYAYSPEWIVQQEIPVRKAHYRFIPTRHLLETSSGEIVEGQCAYVPQLRKGEAVQYAPSSNTYELSVQNVPAFPEEEFMPPVKSLSERVMFYYTAARTPNDFWLDEGKHWAKRADKFASSGSRIQQAVQETVDPGDAPRQKLEKIYDAIMKIENTSFTREHSAEENKAEGFKISSAEDVWTRKTGNGDEIALLFVAMARAAGLKAYPMEVTNRDKALFRRGYLSMDQFDDDIAIVELDGKEQYFDPGQRFCPFGQMHWKHTATWGMRETDHGPTIAETPVSGYKDTGMLRTADLVLAPDGQLTGVVRVLMTGVFALRWRQAALTTDEEAVKKEIQEEIQSAVPAGVEVKTNHFVGLSDYKTGLLVQLDVSGNMGTATSRRIFLPSSFFEGSRKAMFAHDKRELPVDLQHSYQVTDRVTLKLPAGFVPESVPKNAQLTLPQQALFDMKYSSEGNIFTENRALIMGDFLFGVEQYGQLRDFYHKLNAQDQEQLVLKASNPAPATAVNTVPGVAQ